MLEAIRPSSGARARAASSASPGLKSAVSRMSARRMLSSTLKNSAGQSASGTLLRISSAIWHRCARSVSPAIARLLTSSAGPWSHMPVQAVLPTLTRPSSDTLPRSTHRLLHRRSISGRLPSMRSVMLSENSTRYLPRGSVYKKGIEAGDALDLGARHAQRFLQAIDGFRRNPVAGFLYFAQDLHHVR